jgi:hypothetical protein
VAELLLAGRHEEASAWMPLAHLDAAPSHAYSIGRLRMALTDVRDSGLSCG